MKNLLTILCLLACLVACESTDVASAFHKGQEVTITASIGQQRPQALPGMQRVSGKDTDPTNPNGGAIALTWNEGDKILVKVGDDVSEFTLLAGAGTANGSFIGNMPDNGSRFSVQYPTFTPNLAVQQYVENGFDKDLMLMTTKEEGTIDDGFALSADYALLGLQLTGDQQIGKIVLTNPMDNQTYTLHSIHVTLSTVPTLFYFVVPEGEWAEGFKVDIYALDNKTINKTLTKSGRITFSATSATIMPTQWTTPDALDMGLSVQWATCNIGASSPEEYGDYFAWGETEPKETYSSATYKWSDNKKYNTTGGKTILDLEDDAAHVNWGDKWRIPSVEERNELIENCTWEWTTYNDVAGFKAISNKTGNSIFLPAVGYLGSDNPYYPAGQYGLYWLRDVQSSTYAYLLSIQYNLNPPSTTASHGNRRYGFAVRAVYDDAISLNIVN